MFFVWELFLYLVLPSVFLILKSKEIQNIKHSILKIAIAMTLGGNATIAAQTTTTAIASSCWKLIAKKNG